VAQINLLKQKKSSEGLVAMLPALLVKLLVVVLVAVVGYYGWLFFKINRTEKNIVNTQGEVTRVKQELVNVSNRGEIYTRQAQLMELNKLIDSHPYWSNVFPAIAKVTLKKAAYSNMVVNNDGTATISVTVPTLEDVDRYLQVFDMADVSGNFSDLKVGAFHKSQEGDGISYKFDVRLKFNPVLLKYNNLAE